MSYENKGGILLKKTKTLEMRGIHQRYFAEYFISIEGKASHQWEFIGPYWEVELEEEQWHTLGALKIPSTKLTFHVEEDHFDEFIATFRLKFLRCGG